MNNKLRVVSIYVCSQLCTLLAAAFWCAHAAYEQ